MDEIESVQYQGALAVTGTWKGTNTDKTHEELGWENLSVRRWFRRLVQFLKIQNGLTLGYLKISLPVITRNYSGTCSEMTVLVLNAQRPHT